MNKVLFRKAVEQDLENVWQIFQEAIFKRKQGGSIQWQDGYPNSDSILQDIQSGNGYVALSNEGVVVGYTALIFDIEPAYEIIKGEWKSNQPYAVIHRLAVSQSNPIKGLGTFIMQKSEEISVDKDVFSLRADTNFDNLSMLKIFEKLGYSYCGLVYFRGGECRAFEKLLKNKNEI